MLSEEGKIHAAIRTMLNEAWMLREVVCLAMLKDEDAVLCEKVIVKHEVRYLWEIL